MPRDTVPENGGYIREKAILSGKFVFSCGQLLRSPAQSDFKVCEKLSTDKLPPDLREAFLAAGQSFTKICLQAAIQTALDISYHLKEGSLLYTNLPTPVLNVA